MANETKANELNAGQKIEQTKRVFRFALTNPVDCEIDANVLDAIDALYEAALLSHYAGLITIELTPEQQHNLLNNWKFENQEL